MNRHIVFASIVFLTLSAHAHIFASAESNTPRTHQFSSSHYQALANLAVAEYCSKHQIFLKAHIAPNDKISQQHICAALHTDRNLVQAPLNTKIMQYGLQFRQGLPTSDKVPGWSFNPFYTLVHEQKLWL